MRKHVLLGHADRGHAIWWWPGYGVVCPTLVTTNGSTYTLFRSWAAPVSLTEAGAAYFVAWALWATLGIRWRADQ